VRLLHMSSSPRPLLSTPPHRSQPGQVYTLDEMVDDLNADKYLEPAARRHESPLPLADARPYNDPQAPSPLRHDPAFTIARRAGGLPDLAPPPGA